MKENSKRKTNNVTALTDSDTEAFSDSIQSSKTGVMPAVLSLVPKYTAEYNAAASQQNKLPAFLGNLEDEACQHMHFQDLLEHCESINIYAFPKRRQHMESSRPRVRPSAKQGHV